MTSTLSSTQNPLLEIRFPVPFDQVKAAHVEPAIQQLLEQAEQDLQKLAEGAGERTFDNTMLALERVTERLDYAMNVVRHLESVATNPELRQAYNAVQPAVSAFYSRIPLNSGIWRLLNEYAGTAEAAQLSGTRRRLLTKTLDSFRRHGAELDPAGKSKLAEIDVELAKVTTKFAENVLDATNAFELTVTDPEKLAGLPPSAVAAAKQSAGSKQQEGWRFTLQAPSYIAVMTYLDDESIRQTLYRAYSTRATSGDKDNRQNVERILELRREKARLLGFSSFADLVLADRMAKTGASAREFLLRLDALTRRRFEEENSGLESFAGRPLAAWDVGYWAEKQRRELYDFEEEQLRPYFPLEKVVDGMFDVVERLFGITVQEEPGVPAWDEQVKFYRILDSDGTHLGSFYADWFPRENKRDGAWMDALLTASPLDRTVPAHLGLICGNLTPPVDGKPALLTHREVETIFHEFGHLLHHCLSRVEVRSLAGTNVAWDFVELPSQIMENWCWDREALNMFARHYQTGEPIPEELFSRLKRAKNFRSANGQMRQLAFGTIDLSLHIDFESSREGDAVAYARKILQHFSPAPLPEDHSMLTAFNHLFSSPVGYGAGYYSYKWAEVLDADAFTRFQEVGVFSRDVGMSFREHILSRGDSDDPATLYRNFMGRDPDPSALLTRLGLA